ncbi:hypothetical protein NQ314_012785 [Rhamnusium bicolor]|uniref:VPS9 domain-containing protein n=1 Tax=Rhamnusium bicolor TaxID=1586634 RepID=A0AAV8XAH2_9CUCU|nr:hypothetical protein NQ314_012785 [Rhamnusium bicolor]
MWSQYDENLCYNYFFKEIQDRHDDVIKKASEENWIICVPRIGSFISSDISIETILDHILVPGTEQSYSTLSKKQLSVNNKHINIDSSHLFTRNVEILFEETFYVEKSAKYSVWCIDRPLFLKYSYCDSHKITVLENLHDCIDFLWAESLGHDILDNIRRLADIFIQEHEEFESETLQTQKELVGNLYSQCLQMGLKSEVIKDKSMEDSKFLENFKISMETYMQYCVGRKLVFSVNTLQYQTDSLINKVIRNSSELQFQDLNIPDKFTQVITSARCELNKINNYISVLDKIYCLKRTFNIIFAANDTMKDVYITSDDLLQILVFLVLKLNVSNWAANLTYIKEFRFSLLDISDQNSFVITSLEAAIEFIKSNKFLEIKNASSHLSVQSIFDQITSGQITSFENVIEDKCSLEIKLCHPLCTCDKCENLLKECGGIASFNPKYCNEKGQNLLILATILGNCTVVEFLLREGFDVNLSDCLGKTSLHYACSRGFQDILLLLINSGANVNAIDNDKNMPLHLACNSGHENCVKALIYSSGEVELNVGNFFGDTPLHLATKWGYLDIVKILLENGTSIIIQNNRNQTVLDLAPNYYVLKLLRQFGEEKSAKVAQGVKEISQITVEEKNVPDDCKEHGVRPKNVEQCKKIDLLLKAIESNDLPLTYFYLGFPCNFSEIAEKTTCHPLCNCEKCQSGQEFDYNFPQKPSDTININTCNIEGYTPLHIAAKFGRVDILRLLLDCGALPNIRTYKTLYTPLHLACIYQRIQIVRELFKCGDCKCDAQDDQGNTPLFYACLKNDTKIVELLLCNGANCNKKIMQVGVL